MDRFRIEGANWEGRGFVVSPGLVLLLEEVEAWDPVRRQLDGTVASKAHDQVSPNSDHRPMEIDDDPGIVRAADIGELGDPTGDYLAEKLVASRDPRIKYVIHDGMSCWSVPRNGHPAWAWQQYQGANPHENHNHVSVLPRADTDLRPWNLGLEEDDMPLTPEDLELIADAVWFRKITHPVSGVLRGAQALLADSVKYSSLAASKQLALTPEQIQAIADHVSEEVADDAADELAERLQS